jgi:hypothetical protein
MVFIERREFQEITNNTKYSSPFWIPVDRLTLSALQIFAARYMNPQDSETTRLLLKVGAGIGKTFTSLGCAKQYADMFQQLYIKSGEGRYVYIVGYARQVFIREFLKYPELGIITYEELHKMRLMDTRIANSSGANRDRFKLELSAYKQKLKHRITSEKLGGMFRTFGYKQLVGQLFVDKLPETANQSNIFQMYKDKQVKVNKILLAKFKGSVLICDELHLVYNSKEANNYGLAIQFLGEFYKNDIIIIGLSATILNNKAREVIDIANLMRNPDIPIFKSEDYFSNNIPIRSLQPLYDAFKGKVIFLEESTSDYPKLQYEGEPIKEIDYLNFIQCEMSPLHEQTFRLDNLYEETTQHFMIHDMVLPNPEIPLDDLKLFHPKVYNKLSKSEKDRISHYKGLYDSNHARLIIKGAPEEWRKAVGIEVRDLKNGEYVFTGDFLKRENLLTYSTKKVKLLDLIDKVLSEDARKKIFIYHPYVKASGISNTYEVLKHNGYIGPNDIPKPDTYSSTVHITQEQWATKYPDKEFYPSRMVVLDSEVTDKKKEEYIDEYNKPSNKFGRDVQFFLGSQKVKQSVDFKGVQHQIIEQAPTNIPEYIQIKGRSVRRDALAGMPEGMDTVHLYTLCSTSPSGDTLEVKKYRKKVREFKLIQEIEYEINRAACNGYIFYPNGFTQTDILGAKSFKPINEKPDKTIDTNYFGHSYYIDTINAFTNVIKRAFVTNSVWTYDSLWNFCCHTTMSNTLLKNAKDIYNLALKKLIFIPGQSLINSKDIVLFDNENYIINKYYIDGVMYTMPRKVIIEVGEYYILTIIDQYGNIQLGPDCFLSRTQRKIYNTNVLNESKLKLSQDYIKKVIKKEKELDKSKVDMFTYTFLLTFPKEVHYYILQDIIEINYGTKKMAQLPKKYIDTYKKIGVLGKNWYIDSDKKHVFENNHWETYALPHDNRPDNDIIVGMIEGEHFKLRKPVLTEVYVRDKRTVERGMVCTSNVKEDLLKIVSSLNAIKPEKISTLNLCNQILVRLVELEGASRKSEQPKRYLTFNTN